MLSPELRLRLKEAGFPSPLTRDCKCLPSPDLSELIEACGKIYKEKYEFFITWSLDRWFAGYNNGEFSQPDELDAGEGLTPEEAVANLWLELNKK